MVEAPYYDLKNAATLENWNENRHKPGLWAELAGKRIILTVPASRVRHLKDPEKLIEFWDSVIDLHQ